MQQVFKEYPTERARTRRARFGEDVSDLDEPTAEGLMRTLREAKHVQASSRRQP